MLQQGERLATYRLKDKSQKYEPSNFNIVLMTATGEYVASRFGKSFMFSLLNNKTKLQAGKYIFMIDPVWNSSADNSDLYREIMIDVFAPDAVNLAQVDDQTGM